MSLKQKDCPCFTPQLFPQDISDKIRYVLADALSPMSFTFPFVLRLHATQRYYFRSFLSNLFSSFFSLIMHLQRSLPSIFIFVYRPYSDNSFQIYVLMKLFLILTLKLLTISFLPIFLSTTVHLYFLCSSLIFSD